MCSVASNNTHLVEAEFECSTASDMLLTLCACCCCCCTLASIFQHLLCTEGTTATDGTGSYGLTVVRDGTDGSWIIVS
jgi:hypothetical protein